PAPFPLPRPNPSGKPPLQLQHFGHGTPGRKFRVIDHECPRPLILRMRAAARNEQRPYAVTFGCSANFLNPGADRAAVSRRESFVRAVDDQEVQKLFPHYTVFTTSRK